MTAAREQWILANLEAWGKRNEWAARVAALQASRFIPDTTHPAQRSCCCRKFTKERIK